MDIVAAAAIGMRGDGGAPLITPSGIVTIGCVAVLFAASVVLVMRGLARKGGRSRQED